MIIDDPKSMCSKTANDCICKASQKIHDAIRLLEAALDSERWGSIDLDPKKVNELINELKVTKSKIHKTSKPFHKVLGYAKK